MMWCQHNHKQRTTVPGCSHKTQSAEGPVVSSNSLSDNTMLVLFARLIQQLLYILFEEEYSLAKLRAIELQKMKAGSLKNESRRTRGLEIIHEYYKKQSPSTKKEVIIHVQNKLLTEFESITHSKIGYSTVSEWIDIYHNNNESKKL